MRGAAAEKSIAENSGDLRPAQAQRRLADDRRAGKKDVETDRRQHLRPAEEVRRAVIAGTRNPYPLPGSYHLTVAETRHDRRREPERRVVIANGFPPFAEVRVERHFYLSSVAR